MTRVIDGFRSLNWALEGNEKVEKILMEAYGKNERYLSHLDGFFDELRRTRCEGIRDTLGDVNNVNKFHSQISEYKVGMMFGGKGKSVRFLPDSYLDVRSPDILVVDSDKRIYVEVTRATDDESDFVILDFLREYLADKPFMVNLRKKSCLAMPVVKRQERKKKMDLVKITLREFQEKFETELERSASANPPMKIDTVGAVFQVLPSTRDYGYPGIVTTDVAKIPEEDYAEMITKKVADKARKRDDWRGEDRQTLYIIAIHLEHPFYAVTLDDLFLGRRTEILAMDELGRRMREKDWMRIVGNPEETIPNWEEIQIASNKGWKGYLLEKWVIPNSYVYITEPGFFLEECSMRNVSAVLVFGPGDFYSFTPNPFADTEINDPDLIEFV
jgi:hypothetical protein